MRRRAARASRRMSDRTSGIVHGQAFVVPKRPELARRARERAAGRRPPRGPRRRSARRDRASRCFAPQCRRPSAKRAGRRIPGAGRTASARRSTNTVHRHCSHEPGAYRIAQFASPTTAASPVASTTHAQANAAGGARRPQQWASAGGGDACTICNSVRGSSRRVAHAFRRCSSAARAAATHRRVASGHRPAAGRRERASRR